MTASSASRDQRPPVGARLADPAVRAPVKAAPRSGSARAPHAAAEDANPLALAPERAADARVGRRRRPLIPEGRLRLAPEGAPDDR